MASRLHTPSSHGFPGAFVTAALEAALSLPAAVPVFAIAGLQGSGKSTLAAQMVEAAAIWGLRAAVVSIDDFYLTRAERQRLARDVHPLLTTRGPPGTHDVALALEVLDALRDGTDTALPRFDKLADDRVPVSQWPKTPGRIDLAIFEGWFLKTPAESDAALEQPINALERDEDAKGIWRRWCNDALAQAYPPLWERIDQLLFLQPPGFDIVPQWRWQQEQALQATSSSRASMDREGLDRFVQHFERVSRQTLRALPAIADATVALDAGRRPHPAAVRCPDTRGTSAP